MLDDARLRSQIDAVERVSSSGSHRLYALLHLASLPHLEPSDRTQMGTTSKEFQAKPVFCTDCLPENVQKSMDSRRLY